MISLQGVSKTYKMGEQQVHALKSTDLTIESGELVAIVGASGSGKSTLMNLLGLLDKPTAGTYFLNHENTAHMTSNEEAAYRNKTIGFIFQSFYLLSKLTALENVMLPLMYRDDSKEQMKEKAMALLDRVEMQPYAKHHPTELSGGQQQRIAIARALIGDPVLILADEPTGALDTQTGHLVMDLLTGFNKSDGVTLLMITHDPRVAQQCRRIVHIEDGILTEGS